ncbi:hypothetical protein MUO14_23855 [Halobacillus shinanisalinarum]|uniref:Enolase C-terminal domain-containing protein n=1 Tax=Halobacillus shinanisalinarum TaxID=2932258 RepID=A0ABY4H318_9BACI|nr:hypothetical protein [Halobacillus shinanisalinarum]UOQ93367.1 hypothetical protein MUO14_23855 [Halobacillus shinanisalinarum]
MSPEADHLAPQFYPLIKDEPIPENGKLKVDDTPGFGVELNKESGLKEVLKEQ